MRCGPGWRRRPRLASETVFEQVGNDRYRAVSGRLAGEVLQVLRDAGGEVVGLEWATYPFSTVTAVTTQAGVTRLCDGWIVGKHVQGELDSAETAAHPWGDHFADGHGCSGAQRGGGVIEIIELQEGVDLF